MLFSRTKFTIKAKLLLGFSSILFLSSILIANNFYTIDALSEQANRIVSLRVPTQQVGAVLVQGIYESQTALMLWLLTSDHEQQKRRSIAWKKSNKALDDLSSLSIRWTNPENRKRLLQIKNLSYKLRFYQDKIELLAVDLSLLNIDKRLSDEEIPTLDRLIALLNDMKENQRFLL